MEGINRVKILFRFYSDILEEETFEVISAVAVDVEKGYYQVLSIPFYIPKTASGDIVWAERQSNEDILSYRKTIAYSGNSTIHVAMVDHQESIEKVQTVFHSAGCKSVQLNNKYFALEVPTQTDYSSVRCLLTEMQHKRMIVYYESCLSPKH